MDTRHNQLVLISKKVESANEKINDILSRIGWTRAELTQWQKKQGLTRPKRTSAKQNNKTLPSSLFFYQESSSVISFIEPTEKQHPSKHIVDDIHQINQQQQDPCQTYDHIIHRSNQLRQLYHHYHNTNKQTSKIEDMVYQDQKQKKKSKQQESNQQQQQNNRKRAKYRIKLSKMNTPIEIQRDLIHAYMQAFNKQL